MLHLVHLSPGLTLLPRLSLREQELRDRLQVAGNQHELLEGMEGRQILRRGETHITGLTR